MVVTRVIELRQSGPATPEATGSVQFIGTATVLIEAGGFTILTDPNFLHQGEEAKLGYGLRSRRRTEPAMQPSDLPPLDLCLLSHMHGDHWDDVAERELPRDLPVVTTRSAARLLLRRGFTASRGLGTWDHLVVRKDGRELGVTATPGKHGPAVADLLLPPVMGSMLEWTAESGDAVYRLYITGDTLAVPGLTRVRERYPDIDLELIHLGGTRIFGLLVTMDADEGLQAVRMTQPKMVVPVHYDDYVAFKSPLSDFVTAMERAGLDGHLHTLARGERYEFGLPGL